MKRSVRERRFPAAARRPHQRGLTLIELLLSITLLAILTGFLTGGLQLARRGFETNRSAEADGERNSAIGTLASLVGSALPVSIKTGGQLRVVFEGRRDTLMFVALSEGKALQGGPHQVVLRQIGHDVVADFTPWTSNTGQLTGPTRTVVLSGIRKIQFQYLCSVSRTSTPQWENEWRQGERLPDLVSISVEFEDDRPDRAITFLTALRQG